MVKTFYVYILTNKYNTVLYTGVTNNLVRRVAEHRSRTGSKFASKYNVFKLVYYETFPYVLDAIAREKQIKAGSRKKKIDLIVRRNKEWCDLMPDVGY